MRGGSRGGRVLRALGPAILLLVGAAEADVTYWRRLGGPGFVRALAVDPTDASIMYAAVSNAATHFAELGGEPVALGVWRSTDGGASWSRANTGLTTLDASSLVIDPSDPAVVYVGTVGGGVFRSTNGGLSWTSRNTGLGDLDVYALAIDPVTPTTLFAGLRAGGIYRSTDGGGSWSLGSGTPGPSVWQIAIDPAAPATLYAATGFGVRKSTNGGASWSTTGALIRPASPHAEGGAVHDVRTAVVDRSAGSTVLVGTWDGGGVFKSTDAGATWSHASVGLRSEFDNWRFVNVLVQDPLDAGTFYLSSTRSTYRSIDGGSTWAVFDGGLTRAEAYGLATQSSGGGVWIGTVSGDVHALAAKPSGSDHLRCFKAKGRGFALQTVAVTDPFASGRSITLVKPYRFCTPTSVSGEPIADATTHLACYKMRRTPFTRTLQLFLTQRIDGYRSYYVEKPETVCVPAAIAGVPSARPRDAYHCIRGRRESNDMLDLTLTDGFGSQAVRRTKTDRLCYPAGIDGDAVVESDVYLRCDKLLGRRPQAAPTSVTIEDRFGTIALRLQKPDSHCVPALTTRD